MVSSGRAKAGPEGLEAPDARFGTPRPLTERVLADLPGPRALWIALWALAGPLANAAASSFFGYRYYLGPAGLLAWGAGAAAALWLVGRLTRDLAELRPTLVTLTGDAVSGGAGPFSGVASVWAPLLLAALFTLVYHLGPLRWAPGPLTAAVVAAAFVSNVAYWVGGWAYLAVLIGLDRLGRQPLHLAPFEQDLSLGLRPLGVLAFRLFLVYMAVSVVMLPAIATDAPRLVASLLVFLVGVGAFFLSMYRLRQQLVAEKARLRAWVCSLSAHALAPLKAGGGDALHGQALHVLATDVLARQVDAVQEWPVGEGILRTVAAITTSVVAAIVASFLLRQIGM